MAQENAKFVLEGYAMFNAAVPDPEELGRWQEAIWHEDAEYHAAEEDPDSAVHRGMDALKRHTASWVEAYPDLNIEPMESKEKGDKVFVWVQFSGHGGTSGAPVDMELAHVLTVRDGKIVRLVEYTDRTKALEATGLSESALLTNGTTEP